MSDNFKLIKNNFPKKMVYKSKDDRFVIMNLRLLPKKENGDIPIAFEAKGNKVLAMQFVEDHSDILVKKLMGLRV